MEKTLVRVASKLRKAAADDDFDTFRTGIPQSLKDDKARELYAAIQKGMKLLRGNNRMRHGELS